MPLHGRPLDFSHTETAPAALDHLLAPPGRMVGATQSGSIQFFPPRIIELNRFDLPLKRWPASMEGFRIAHLSDFHLRRHWPRALDLLLDHLSANPPDLLLMTGDFVDNKRDHRPAMPLVRRMVGGFKARLGCFAIHGNHDSYQIGAELRNSQVTFLDGRRHMVDLPGGQIELIGFPGKHRRELLPGFLKFLPEPDPAVPRIVLSHFPDHLKRTGGLGADLFLAGHTHGGQICAPGGRPLMWHDHLPRRLCRGAHRVGETWLVVNRGLGYTGIPLRMYSTPEAIEIRCHSSVSG